MHLKAPGLTIFSLSKAFKPKLKIWGLRPLSQVLEVDRGEARYLSLHPSPLPQGDVKGEGQPDADRPGGKVLP